MGRCHSSIVDEAGSKVESGSGEVDSGHYHSGQEHAGKPLLIWRGERQHKPTEEMGTTTANTEEEDGGQLAALTIRKSKCQKTPEWQ